MFLMTSLSNACITWSSGVIYWKLNLTVNVLLKHVSDDIALKCMCHKLLFRDLSIAILVNCFHHLLRFIQILCWPTNDRISHIGYKTMPCSCTEQLVNPSNDTKQSRPPWYNCRFPFPQQDKKPSWTSWNIFFVKYIILNKLKVYQTIYHQTR